MRRVLTATCAVVVAVSAAVFGWPTPAEAEPEAGQRAERQQPGIRVEHGRLVEATGSDLVLRGVNHDVMWYPDRHASYAGIKAAGANAVRVPLGIGHRWRASDTAEVARIVTHCRQNRLICVLDAHDTTGYGLDRKAARMSQAVDFWLRVQPALHGQEHHVIVNIANEPFANGVRHPWAAETVTAIRRLRAAGFKHTLMVDGPGWGQDESFVMRDNAAAVLAADPTGNTVFDIHMYGMFNTAEKVRSYLASFTDRRLPIVIGEFSGSHEWGDPDEDAIMAYAEANHLGYFGWSWSGNSGEYSYLDLVSNFDASSRTAWGNRFFAGANGLSATAREATIYRSRGGPAQPPPVTGVAPPRGLTVSGVGVDRVTVRWAGPPRASAGLYRYELVRVQGSRETRVALVPGESWTVGDLRPSTEYAFAVYARDLFGKRSVRTGPVYVVTQR